MKKKLIIPKFKSESEESRFWANLDLMEYFEPSDFRRGVVFPQLKRSKRLVSIRLPDELIVRVKDKASKLEVPYQSLIRRYIQQGVAR
ncbi:MAG: BrnA antitoxin family protein [Candidatus Blackburnbacteria bacterium]|nr:BrnA antitoxin family protein [Candidatus Blackburnbacteria bacterium]